MVRVMQEKDNKRAPKSMGKWRLARLARIRCELELYRKGGALEEPWTRMGRLRAREQQLVNALEDAALKYRDSMVRKLAPKGWTHV